MLTTGVIATSRKPHERRVAIHPAHLELIPSELREHMVFERGYGRRFGVADEQIAAASSRAIEVRGGVVLNPRILSFQKRSPDYPHSPVADPP